MKLNKIKIRHKRLKIDEGEKPRLKVDKGDKPKRKLTKYPFDKMKPGDSFHYKGSRTSAIISFGYHLADGKYKTEREDDGWRFHLLKKE